MANLQSIKTKYGIVGESEQLTHILNVALQVAPTDLSVLIIGESGVGKEVIPRIIHDNSKRSKKKYVAVNCGSIPEGTIDSELFGHEKGAFTGAIGEHDGYFGAADGGTLFLDEVGELPMNTQARLLRVLETGEYMRVGSSEVRKTNVRIVAATNVNMAHAIANGKFRQDLYYRINTIPIKMPALRERGEDVLKLFKMFAMETALKYQMEEPIQLDNETQHIFLSYPWPGNVRQLKNITEQLSVLITGKRVVTRAILETQVPEMLNVSDKGIVMSSHTHEQQRYDTEREIIFKMLLELHADIENIKAILGLKHNDNNSNLIDFKQDKYGNAEEYEEAK